MTAEEEKTIVINKPEEDLELIGSGTEGKGTPTNEKKGPDDGDTLG